MLEASDLPLGVAPPQPGDDVFPSLKDARLFAAMKALEEKRRAEAERRLTPSLSSDNLPDTG